MDPESATQPAIIRGLSSDDRKTWGRLWANYVSFYRQSLDPDLAALTFSRLCQNEDGMFGLVAEEPGGEIVGFAHCVTHRSSWREGWNCYLEDLFVEPRFRGRGVAASLIEAAKAHSREKGAVRLYWLTQPYNGRARSLYDRVGNLISRVVYESTL